MFVTSHKTKRSRTRGLRVTQSGRIGPLFYIVCQPCTKQTWCVCLLSFFPHTNQDRIEKHAVSLPLECRSSSSSSSSPGEIVSGQGVDGWGLSSLYQPRTKNGACVSSFLSQTYKHSFTTPILPSTRPLWLWSWSWVWLWLWVSSSCCVLAV